MKIVVGMKLEALETPKNVKCYAVDSLLQE